MSTTAPATAARDALARAMSLITHLENAPQGLYHLTRVYNELEQRAAAEAQPTDERCSWTFKITVDDVWVADGFNPSAEQLRSAVMDTLLGDAYGDEVAVELVKAPTQVQLLAASGRVDGNI